VEAAEGVHFERAWLDPESGMVFCLSTGPSKEAVRRVHEKAGHPADEIYELPVEV
jgi:Nickel responsive protein SCO4226-like